MATSSAGTRATSIALQLKVSSSVGRTRATTNFVSSSEGSIRATAIMNRATTNEIVVACL